MSVPTPRCMLCMRRLLPAQPFNAAPASGFPRRLHGSAHSRASDSPSDHPGPARPPSPPGASQKSSVDSSSAHASRVRELVDSFSAVAQSRLRRLSSNASDRRAAFESTLAQMGGKISQVTGYETIEGLRRSVVACEQKLLEERQKAVTTKEAYTYAVEERSRSQREVNDLLQRKSTWQSNDVMRFTELVQADHANEMREREAKKEMQDSELQVEACFQELMKAILERYHEEQIWSDKIRSLSTYGSLSITGLNVLLFIVTILLVEPWKRRRLVEGVEARLRENTRETHEATQASIVALQTLLTQQAGQHRDEALSTPAVAAPEQTGETTPTLPEDHNTTLDEAQAAEASMVDSRWLRYWRQAQSKLPPRHSDEETALVGISAMAIGAALSLCFTAMR